MRESVRTVNSPWIVGGVIAAMGLGYFFLLGTAEYREPGPQLKYNVDTWREVDNVETRFEEVATLKTKIENPRALALDDDGKLYVTGENAMVVFENDKEVDRIEVDGTVRCMTVDSDGTRYLGFRDHVAVMSAAGKIEQKWDTVHEAFFTSIDIEEDHVYVADAGNRVVYQFAKTGTLVKRIGEKNEKESIPGFLTPGPFLDLAVNPDGFLWVVNPGKLGLERYRTDGSMVTSWYKPDLDLDGFSGCCNPTHVAFTNDGRLITAEKGLVRLKVYDVTSGEFQELIAGSKLFPREQSLRDIIVDGNNRILALDPRTNSVRIFDEKEHENG